MNDNSLDLVNKFFFITSHIIYSAKYTYKQIINHHMKKEKALAIIDNNHRLVVAVGMDVHNILM